MYRRAILSSFIVTGAFLGIITGLVITPRQSAPRTLLSPLPLSTGLISTSVLGVSKNTQSIPRSNVNVLLLGLDARIGDTRPRCDAIHLFQLNLTTSRLRITTIPRGTVVSLPEIPQGSAYIGNVCHYKGIDAIRDKVALITGVVPDYYVTVGFSQTLGILRTLGLPTTSTLQFLRSRATALGDHQRSFNQATFLRDFILTNTHNVAKIPKPIRYLLYQLIDTDMDYETANSFFEAFINSNIAEKPDAITLATKPDLGRPVKDRHYSDNVTEAIDKQGSEEDFLAYQSTVETNLVNLTARAKSLVKSGKLSQAYALIKTPYLQYFWMQLEDETKREKYHWDLLDLYVRSHPQRETASSTLLDYTTEMETFGFGQYVEKAKSLQANLEI